MKDKPRQRERVKRPPKPLSRAAMEDLALAYVARFATSAAKLERYLARKLRERGWEPEGEEADLSALVARFVDKGYIDDAAYARARSADLLRRGYGANRVNQALGQAGIAEPVREQVRPAEAVRRRAALHLATKRRFGPFSIEPPDREKREKQIAAMLRAGHSFDHACAVLDASSEEQAQQWAAEAEDWDDDELA